MQIYLRYAANTDDLPNPFPTRAYDERMLYVLEGEGEMRFADRTVPIRRDTLCYYPSGTEYCPVSCSEIPMKFITLNFDFSRKYETYTRGRRTVPSAEYRPEMACETHNACGESLFQTYFILNDACRFRGTMLRIAEEFVRGEPYAREVAASLLQAVCYEILAASGEEKQNVCRSAAEYIEQHFAETIDNRSVAQALNYHHNYLNAVFRREMGTTLHRYLMQVRLKKAAELLQESKDSVAEVASRVGFLNADHFSRRFSEQYGVSPSRYRKGIGKEETVRREDGQNGKSV